MEAFRCLVHLFITVAVLRGCGNAGDVSNTVEDDGTAASTAQPTDTGQSTESSDDFGSSSEEGSTETSGTETTGTETTGTPTESTGGDSWRRICDGSQVLRMALVLTGGGLLETELFREVGFNYLYVRGDCRYWALDQVGRPPWQDTRTGVLTLEQEEALSRSLLYDRWPELEGKYPAGGYYDAGFLMAYDGKHAIWCRCDTEITGPAELSDGTFTTNVESWWEELWTQGDPIDGGALRVILTKIERATPVDTCAQPAWPFAWDPDEIAVPQESSSGEWGQSARIDDPVRVDEFRMLRTTYRDGDVPMECNPLLQVGMLSFQHEDPTIAYTLVMRDSVPLEDDRGLIQIPKPPERMP